MRHLSQISDDCLTVNVFAKREWNFEMCFCLIPIGGLQEIAKFHHRFSSIRQLDAHSVFSGNRREDINPLRTSRPGKVSLEANDFVHTHALCWVNFVARNSRALGNVARRYCDAELRQRLDQDLLDIL